MAVLTRPSSWLPLPQPLQPAPCCPCCPSCPCRAQPPADQPLQSALCLPALQRSPRLCAASAAPTRWGCPAAGLLPMPSRRMSHLRPAPCTACRARVGGERRGRAGRASHTAYISSETGRLVESIPGMAAVHLSQQPTPPAPQPPSPSRNSNKATGGLVLERPAADLRNGRLPTVVSGAKKSFPLKST